ncbi:magnesium transporter [Limibaculum sp. M0105]|uniref:Magnesium transporter MgtE n=1 Tax=Thermohalobaculum xanthum TaxID=2753746 RepID=A0A8J7M5X7_9RHOB|nr:magnesium transporter [Thermohalobaculum xanthum]MBK0398437.1 magnesium transporter [Thermohalobaculum xanthum]
MTETQPVIPEPVDEDDAFDLDPEKVTAVIEAVRAGDKPAVLELIEDLHVADLADLLEQIDSETRRQFLDMAWSDIDQEVLVEVEEGVRDDILSWLEPERLAEAAREFETDDVVYLLEDLDEEQQRQVLEALEPEDRVAVAKSLTYPEYSAGRLMQTDFVKAPPFWTVGQMIDFLRASAGELPEQFYDIVVVDPAMKPVGTIPLSKIIGTRRPVTLSALMDEDFRTLHVEDAQEDVAYAFKQYHLVSAPVVDDDGRLVGVITIDDAVEVLDDEAEEDLKRLGGVGDEEISDRVWEITRQRFPWLGVNLMTAILASLVISLFEGTIQQIVALAVLMPIVASMGGNAGTQTLTVAVRALATRDLTPTNAMRVVARETVVGFFNGVGFAIVMGLIAWFWFEDPHLGMVIAAAMVVNLLVAGLSGILIPLALDRAGADPALASGTFVTTVTDVVGFFSFLGLAALVLL